MKRISISCLFMLVIALGPASTRASVGTISGPLTHRNLQIFLVHGNTRLEDRHYATLSEAMAKGIVVVRELAMFRS